MFNYILRRLFLLPMTLFCIVFVNFFIINLAPGDPVTITQISATGDASRRADRAMAFGSDDRYLQFREHYGLTLPIIVNTWPSIDQQQVVDDLSALLHRESLSIKDYDALRIRLGDQARFIMPKLLHVMDDPSLKLSMRLLASRFFIRGGTRQAILGPNLTPEQKGYNRKIGEDNNTLNELLPVQNETEEKAEIKFNKLKSWYEDNRHVYDFEPSFSEKAVIFFTQTRFYRYMSKVLTLDFGTMRNDDNKTVLSEVAKRFKYSLTLALLPMLITFVLCQFFGCLMAYMHHRGPDYLLNILFLVLYAIPVFVVAPFLIEKVALNHTFPFTDISIPISGFTSPDAIYNQQTSLQRLFDTFQHIILPLLAILYGSLAAEARLSRTAVLEVLRQDYVRTARAKGVPMPTLLIKHVGRNAAITIVTSLAGSLGIVLGGSLIVETLFQINGFGKFFYDAILNRDYNVILFSALAGSFLSLVGYLVADIAYTVLDPRLTLD